MSQKKKDKMKKHRHEEAEELKNTAANAVTERNCARKVSNADINSDFESDNEPDLPPDVKEPEGDGNEENSANDEEKSNKIAELGSIAMSKGRHILHCITIIGQIEGHFLANAQTKTTKYEHVIPQLVAIEDDPNIEGLLIILNTVGGDVEAGLALAELIAGMKKPTVSLVLGGGHSIGVPLAVSAKQSFITETATMTIHPVRMNGVILGVPQSLGYFYRMQDRITRFVCENSHIKATRFKQLMMNTSELVMDVGTVLDGKKAVEEGLIDNLGGLSDAIEALNKMIDENGAKERHKAPKKATKVQSKAKNENNSERS